MKKTLVLLGVWCITALSCTKEKTAYRPDITPGAPGNAGYQNIATAHSGDFDICIQTLNGTLHRGYNDLRIYISDQQTHAKVDISQIRIRPISTTTEGLNSSAPHQRELIYHPEEGYFNGHAVFPEVSGEQQNWLFDIEFTANDQQHALQLPIDVEEQPNSNLSITAFSGKDGGDYLIALVAPQQPQVGENKLVAGIYRLDVEGQQRGYIEVNGYTLLLDPRMPEPSMGNHSSPNNVDLTQQDDGLYHGVVNYTMTGNWTLNLIMLNHEGRIIKGTEVPDDFTPGVAGEKSELHIDILF